MKRFVKRVSQKISKLTSDQVEQIVDLITEENETLDAVLESLSTGLLICDENWVLVQSNKAAERYLPLTERAIDWTNQEVKNDTPIWDFIDNSDISDFIKDSAIHQKNTSMEEFTLQTPQEVSRIIQISTMPLVQDKHLVGNIIKIDDITEKKNQETLLRRMESLASLTNLAASVAHEIKNPLGSISIHIQLIQKAIKKARETDGLLPDEKFTDKYLNIVNEEIDRLNNIIVDFLFAVRPISATLESINPSQLINEFADFFLPELKKKQIDLEKDLLQKPVHVMLDEKLFKQVLMNLVQNAIAAMPNGGKLWIKTIIKNEKYVITVADNGIGMNEETLQRIFEPYFTTKTTGTGLGLTMVYKIIKELGGNIDVQSFVGEGTIFAITFPLQQKEIRFLDYAGA